MAKINVHPRPGALSALLKRKEMTQMDASEKTGVDRKTLLKIDRGAEVKLETLQKVANKLQVTEEYFLPPPAAEVTGDGDVPEPGTITIMLRKLDATRLVELLRDAERIEWHLNAKIRDEEACKFLKDFETAVDNYHRDLRGIGYTESSNASRSLRNQLERLKTADDVTTRLELFAGHRLALLGAEHLFWVYSAEANLNLETPHWCTEIHNSLDTLRLSVEPFGAQSRRTHVSIGRPPPPFAPITEIRVYVNGAPLPTQEELVK